ncbi:Bax inhibitor-1/YccA family protein [uncultured Campylobacter sp.]|uniref:Bax inhibitor-1/YccA family protein n=1 Tax=uncultured Campylobacter sp. TaxID=218934 RepID=UPI00262C3B50|nr:Bax inhibitor-1/YccA family protein [uncultured Campylobacter sp.]
MSLYDRDYLAQSGEVEIERSRATSIVRDTYKLLTASLIAATAGAYVGMGALAVYNWLLFFIVEMALIFGMHYTVAKGFNSIALALLFAFTFITGFGLAPILNAYIAHGAGHVITNAFLTTALVFGVLTVYAINTKTDVVSWGKSLFYILLAVIVVSILNLLFFKSGLLDLVISAITAVLFSCYIVYDTQNIFKGRYESPILAAVSMYLNILNLFLSLLRLFGSRD